jgi:hypothetical protein
MDKPNCIAKNHNFRFCVGHAHTSLM